MHDTLYGMPKKETTTRGAVDYQLCVSLDHEEMADKVSKLLAEGWTLYGDPAIAIKPTDPNDSSNIGSPGALFCQALIRLSN